jgi:Leucine-rich repeat (LRR) protein
LNGLTKLRTLTLTKTQITDDGLRHVSGLTELLTLRLDSTQITDDGLRHLIGLNNLLQLNLNDTQVTDEGTLDLKKQLPNCEIRINPHRKSLPTNARKSRQRSAVSLRFMTSLCCRIRQRFW